MRFAHRTSSAREVHAPRSLSPPRTQTPSPPAPNSSKSILRCHYCETDIDDFVIADRAARSFSADVSALQSMSAKDFGRALLFADANAAEAAGYRRG